MNEELFISLILPAFNEQDRIAEAFEHIKEYFTNKTFAFEVILVDDGSNDDTVSIIQRLAEENNFPLQVIKSKKNFGKGHAVRTGMLASKGRYVFFSDVDFSCPIWELDKFINILDNGIDIAIASRALKESNLPVRQPWWREIMGKCFNRFVQLIAIPGVCDTQCGFKGLKQEAAQRIFKQTTVNRFAFDVEILILAKRCNYRVQEVPVTWRHSAPSKVHALQDALIMLKDLVKLRLLYNKKGVDE